MNNIKLVPRNFMISKKESSSFCRISNPTDSKSWEILKFRMTLNGFPGIPVKLHKVWEKFIDSQSALPSLYYRISNVLHGGGGDASEIVHYRSSFKGNLMDVYPPSKILEIDTCWKFKLFRGPKVLPPKFVHPPPPPPPLKMLHLDHLCKVLLLKKFCFINLISDLQNFFTPSFSNSVVW